MIGTLKKSSLNNSAGSGKMAETNSSANTTPTTLKMDDLDEEALISDGQFVPPKSAKVRNGDGEWGYYIK